MSCKPEVENNNFISLGSNVIVSFYLNSYQERRHMRFHDDYGKQPTLECYEFSIDSSKKSNFSICYYPESDTTFSKEEIQNLQSHLFTGIFFKPNETIITHKSITQKNGIYFIIIKYSEENKFNSILYLYSKNKLVECHFLDFIKQEDIDAIVESIEFHG